MLNENDIFFRFPDLCTLAGSEAFVSALTVYKLFSTASASGIGGAKTVYEQLKERFTQVPEMPVAELQPAGPAK